jgi:anti-anti-sigma regulatory factor
MQPGASVLQFVKAVEQPCLVLNLTPVQYCNSAFLGILVRLSKRLRVERSGRFGVCNLSKYPQTVDSASKNDQIVEAFENSSAASAADTSTTSVDEPAR